MATIPTSWQVIQKNGKPEFLVIPYGELEHILKTLHPPFVPSSPNTPWEVVDRYLSEGISKSRAWREYLGLSQDLIAQRMGVTQSAVSQIEEAKRPRKKTLEKYAAALGISYEQLR